MPRPPKVTPKTMNEQKRIVKALELRASGATYLQIAEYPWPDAESGMLYAGDRHNARRAIVTAFEKTVKEPADEVRQLEVQRLDMMLLGLAKKGLFNGNVQAVTAGLSLMARRAKLLGLDAPTEINQRGGGNIQLVVDPAALHQGMDPATLEITEDNE